MTQKHHQYPIEEDQQNVPDGLLVSVVIPTFNHASIVTQCLDALLEQDFPREKYEVIVIDDGSSDNTRETVAGYIAQWAGIKYFHQANQGPAAARNHGAKEACGEILMFTDDDCVPQSDWISEMYKPFAEDSTVVAVKGAYKTKQESVIAQFAQAEFESRYRKMRQAERIDFVDTYSAAFKREVFLALKGFDTSFPEANNEDVEFSYRMAEKGYKMVFNSDAIVYHTHPDTLLKYLKVKFGRAYWRMAVYRAFPEKMKSDSYTPQTLKLQIALCFLLVLSLVLSLTFDISRMIIAVILAFFVLTSLPFVFSVLNLPWLDRLLSFLAGFMKRGYIRRLVKGLKASFDKSVLKRLLARLWFITVRLERWIISLLRKTYRAGSIVQVRKAVKRTTLFLMRDLPSVCFRLLWGIACFPKFLIVLIMRVLKKAVLFVYNLRGLRWLRRLLNRIACTRPVMALLAVGMLLLRSAVMGLGILWGLQSQRSNKGRFSQTVLLIAGDVAGVLAACAAAYASKIYLLDKIFHQPVLPMAVYIHYLPVMVLAFIIVFFMAGLYRPYGGFSQVSEFASLTKSALTVTLITFILVSLTAAYHVNAMVVLLFFYALFFVSLARAATRKFVGSFGILNNQAGTRVLIVGTGEMARMICRKLEGFASVNTAVVGFVDKDPDKVGAQVDQHEVIGSFDDIHDLVEHMSIQEVFVALPMMDHDKVIDLVNKHSGRAGTHFHVISNLFDLISAEVNIAEQNNIPITYLKNENMELVQVIMKRVFDVVFATLVLILTLPFWALIMLAIKLETDGSPIFRQERVGKNNRIFLIYKFRTMYADTDKYEYSPSRPDDKRITRVGKFLRKTSLDEFPQFLNILKGEMSVVGPRPEMPFIVDKYTDWQRQRLKVKPGLTGLWQIMGRKDLPLHETLEYDFYYIKNQSLLLDLTILLKTIPVVLFGKGAY